MARAKYDIDSKTEEAFYYAVNFYSTNDRSLEKQRFCLEQLMKITGFDAETCCKIQTPIMNVFMMGELMQIGSKIAQQHLTTITHNIRQHLLAVQSTLQPEKVSELPHIPTLGGSSSTSKKRDIDGVNVQVKNIVQDVTINGYKGQKALVMSNYDLEPHDMNYLSATMPSHSYNFSLVDFSNNPRIGAVGLDYTLKGAPGIFSIQSGITDLSSMYQGVLTRSSFNIVKLYLSNCSIGDVGADILAHALVSRKLPATKHIDVSGNKITQKGATKIVQALNSDHPAKGSVIILEKQSSLSGVKSFMKKAFTYYAGEIKKYLDNQQKTNEEVAKIALKVYGNDDWAHCKKFVSEGGVAVGMGVSSKMAHPITRMLMKAPNPYVKAAVFGGIVIDASIESMGSVDWKDAGYCIAKTWESILGKSESVPDDSSFDVEFIGNSGEEYDF